jgi:hypothetical protein
MLSQAMKAAAACLFCLGKTSNTILFCLGKTSNTILFFILAMLVGTQAQATDVGGVLSGSNTWILAGSPYVVVSDLTVNSQLTIESGVQVRVRPGFSVTVNGRLIANGVVFTSSRDVSGASPAAAKGDWGPLVINNQNANELRNSIVRFGKGLQFVDAKASLQGARIENNEGSAISQDLASSLDGTVASVIGNDVNALKLSGSNHLGGFRFAVTGVPYLIDDQISFGPLPISIGFSQNRIQVAQSVTATVELLDVAPVGGTEIVLTTDPPDQLTIPASVIVPAGERQVQFNVTALELGYVEVTAEALDIGVAQAAINVIQAPTFNVSLQGANSPGTTIATGFNYRVNVSVFQAPKDNLTIALSSSDTSKLTVPASIEILAGQTFAQFTARAISAGSANLLVSAPTFETSTTPVTIRDPNMQWPNPLLLPLGNQNIEVDLSDPVPAGGASFNVTTSNSAVLQLPGTVTAPAGAREVNIQAVAGIVGTAEVSISNPIFGTKAATATVANVEMQVSGNTLIPKDLTERFFVRLLTPAPNAGTTINLSADSSDVTITPATITIPGNGGQFNQAFDVRSTAQTPFVITASGPGLQTKTFNVAVGPRAELRLQATDPRVGVLMRGQASVGLRMGTSSYQSNQPRTVSIVSSNAQLLTTQATVITSGSSIGFSLAGVAVGDAQLSATSPDIDSGSLSLSVVKPEVRLLGLAVNRPLLSARDDFEIRFGLPGDNGNVAPVSDQIVGLSIVDAQPNNVVPGIYETATSTQLISSMTIPAQNPFGLYRFVGQPAVAGTYRVRATYQGDNYDSATQTAQGLGLRFTQQSYIVGKGLRATGLRIERTNGNVPYAPPTGLLVGINNVDSTRFSTPAQVEIPFNQSSVFVPLVGLQVTQQSVNLSAFTSNGAGYSPAPAINISVVEPNVVFSGLSSPILNGPRNRFRLRFEVPDSSEPLQITTIARSLTLDVANATPPNIVSGIYDASTNGNLVTNVEIAANQNQSAERYVGNATSLGSYQVRASSNEFGNSPWLSAAQASANQTNTIFWSFNDTLSITKGFYQSGAVSLQDVAFQPVLIQLSSNPPGAIVFDPPQVTIPAGSSTSPPIKVIGSTSGSASITATGPVGWTAAQSSVQVEPLIPNYIYAFHETVSLNFNGAALNPVPVTASVFEVSPAGSVSAASCPAAALADSTTYSCTLTRDPNQISNFRIRLDFGSLGIAESGVLNTDFNFNAEGYQIGQYQDAQPIYSYPCREGAQFAVQPPTLGSAGAAFTNEFECGVYLVGLEPGTGVMTATIASGGSTTYPLEVTPLNFSIYFPEGQTNVARSFYVYASGSPPNAVPLIVSIVDASPQGIVSFTANGGTTVNTDYSSGSPPLIALTQPTGAGSYRIKVDAAGFGVFYSDVQQVSAVAPNSTDASKSGEQP